MIDIKDVHKRYGSFEAVRGVTFSADKGEILGLLGPNGAGKTTLMKILTTYHFPSTGQARVGGFDVYADPLSIRRIVGYLPERTPLYDDSTVLEYLGFVMDARALAQAKRVSRLDYVLTACGIEDVAHQSLATLSKGYRQRVGLAQAIIHDPEILILDEPTTGLDPNQILEIRQLIRSLGRQKTVILSTHILQEVEALCDRVIILHHGEVVAAGTTDEIEGSLRGDVEFSVIVRGSVSIDALASAPGVHGVETDPAVAEQQSQELRLVVRAARTANAAEAIFDWAVDSGAKLLELHQRTRSLEQVFSQLTRATGTSHPASTEASGSGSQDESRPAT